MDEDDVGGSAEEDRDSSEPALPTNHERSGSTRTTAGYRGASIETNDHEDERQAKRRRVSTEDRPWITDSASPGPNLAPISKQNPELEWWSRQNPMGLSALADVATTPNGGFRPHSMDNGYQAGAMAPTTISGDMLYVPSDTRDEMMDRQDGQNLSYDNGFQAMDPPMQSERGWRTKCARQCAMADQRPSRGSDRVRPPTEHDLGCSRAAHFESGHAGLGQVYRGPTAD